MQEAAHSFSASLLLMPSADWCSLHLSLNISGTVSDPWLCQELATIKAIALYEG